MQVIVDTFITGMLIYSNQRNRMYPLTIASYFDHHFFSLAGWLPQIGYSPQPTDSRCHPDGSLRWDLLLGRFDLFPPSPEHEFLWHARHSNGTHLHECKYRERDGKRVRLD